MLDFILFVIRNGYKIFFIFMLLFCCFMNNVLVFKEVDFVNVVILEFLYDNCVEEIIFLFDIVNLLFVLV